MLGMPAPTANVAAWLRRHAVRRRVSTTTASPDNDVLAGLKKSTLYRSVLDQQNIRVDIPITATPPMLGDLCRCSGRAKKPDIRLVARDRQMARNSGPTNRTTISSCRNSRSSGCSRRRRARLTSPPKSASTRCGRRSSSLRGTAPLDDVGRLGTMGYGRRRRSGPGRPSRQPVIDIAGDASADDDAGDVDGRSA